MDNICTGKFCRLIPVWGIRRCCQLLTGAKSKHCRISFIDPSVEESHYRAVRHISWKWEERTAEPYRNAAHLVIYEVASCIQASPSAVTVLELAAALAGITVLLWLHVYVVHWAQQDGSQVLYFIKRHAVHRNNPIWLLVCTEVQFCIVMVVEKWIKQQVGPHLLLKFQTLWKVSVWLRADS